MNTSEAKLVILDYNLGNIFSVKHACNFLGYDPIISADPSDLENADAVILPGVGAFKEAMVNLRESGLDQAIYKFVETGKPFMGVCLGLQLLFETSEEFSNATGLGLIKGEVLKLQYDMDKNLKVPHIGWTNIKSRNENEWADSPLEGLSNGEPMYFVHSYYVKPTEEDVILCETEFDETTFCSGVKKDNIFAVQFHPEKSADKGLIIYKNWLKSLNV